MCLGNEYCYGIIDLVKRDGTSSPFRYVFWWHERLWWYRDILVAADKYAKYTRRIWLMFLRANAK
jgi:hypothetical protein